MKYPRINYIYLPKTTNPNGRYYFEMDKKKCDAYVHPQKMWLKRIILNKVANSWKGYQYAIVQCKCDLCGLIFYRRATNYYFCCPNCSVIPAHPYGLGVGLWSNLTKKLLQHFTETKFNMCQDVSHYIRIQKRNNMFGHGSNKIHKGRQPPFYSRKRYKKIVKGPISVKATKYLHGEYHILFQCHICKKYFSRDVDHSVRIKCPYCNGNISKGELACRAWLINHDLRFDYGYISKAHYKGRLHFDFWLPNKRIAIEYDGLQHFKPINYFGGIKAYKDEKKRDHLKNKYCKSHKITLIRIPYWDFNKIPNILHTKLS